MQNTIGRIEHEQRPHTRHGDGGKGTSGEFLPGTAILLISNGFLRNYERGFANGLAESGADVTLISSDNTDYPGLHRGVKTVNLRGSQTTDRSRWEKAVNFVQYQLSLIWYVLCIGLFKRPSARPIVHVFGLIQPPLLFGVFNGLLFKLLSKRYVLTIHDILPRDGCTPTTERFFAWSYKIADRLVVHTEGMRTNLCAKFAIDPQHVTVMEHGLEPAAFTPGPRDESAPVELLAFGHVKHYKGVDVLLEALETYPEPFVLRIVGVSLDPELTATLRGLIAKHPHSAQISWRDEHVEEAVMEEHFMTSDVLVLPYRHIDQSGVLFQALRFGVPIVATQVGSLGEYVTPEIGEMCPPNDPAALRDTLLHLTRRYRHIDRSKIVEASRRWGWTLIVAESLPRAYTG